MTPRPRPVIARFQPNRRRFRPGFSVAPIRRDDLPWLDPLLMIDLFEMAEPHFPPHPHAGFSAVTYILPESANGFVNRDSLGGLVTITPGSLHWTVAGRGVVHEEVPCPGQGVATGLQVFVDLPAAAKWRTPEALHLAAGEVPTWVADGATVRVLVGSDRGRLSPLQVPTPLTWLDVTLARGGRLVHPVPAGESRLLLVLQGQVAAGGFGANPLAAGTAAAFGMDGDEIHLAGPTGARCLLLGGPPLRQPVHWRGPFCMTSPVDLERAMADYSAGRMGRLEPSF